MSLSTPGPPGTHLQASDLDEPLPLRLRRLLEADEQYRQHRGHRQHHRPPPQRPRPAPAAGPVPRHPAVAAPSLAVDDALTAVPASHGTACNWLCCTDIVGHFCCPPYLLQLQGQVLEVFILQVEICSRGIDQWAPSC